MSELHDLIADLFVTEIRQHVSKVIQGIARHRNWAKKQYANKTPEEQRLILERNRKYKKVRGYK